MNLPLWANLLGLAAVGAWIAAQLLPFTRAVRLRNSIRAKRGDAATFDWTPENIPAEFRCEQQMPSEEFRIAVATLQLDGIDSEWERARQIAAHLVAQAKDLGPVQSDLVTTYRRILRGYGYCADFVKVFIGLALAAGVFTRQWAFAFDGFGGHGHTFVEVFDSKLGKWVAIDVYNNVHFCAVDTGVPLGALELRHALMNDAQGFKVVLNGVGRLGFPIEEKLLAYWRRGLAEWYLYEGNAVFSYEKNSLVRLTSRLSRALGQVFATTIGVQSAIRVVVTPENVGAVQALFTLRRRFLRSVVVFVLLCVLLAAQLLIVGNASWVGGG